MTSSSSSTGQKTATRTFLPVPCGRLIAHRTCWSGYFWFRFITIMTSMVGSNLRGARSSMLTILSTASWMLYFSFLSNAGFPFWSWACNHQRTLRALFGAVKDSHFCRVNHMGISRSPADFSPFSLDFVSHSGVLGAPWPPYFHLKRRIPRALQPARTLTWRRWVPSDVPANVSPTSDQQSVLPGFERPESCLEPPSCPRSAAERAPSLVLALRREVYATSPSALPFWRSLRSTGRTRRRLASPPFTNPAA
mmetsp:Transcript_73375/g.228905  ORF Transcript_73375/g.228905 Transcript_73375/m.228905 type:complete len:251 (+) Transcript_73375:371-1123(+)